MRLVLMPGLVVIGVGLWALNLLPEAGAKQRAAALLLTQQATEGYTREGEILAAKDGSLVNVVVRLAPGRWNESLPIFQQYVAKRAPEKWESPQTDWVYSLFFSYEKKRIKPVQLDRNAACKVVVVCRLKGLRRALYETLALFKASAVDKEKSKENKNGTIGSGIFAAWLWAIKKRVNKRLDEYYDARLLPLLELKPQQNLAKETLTAAATLPSGVAVSYVSVEFSTGTLYVDLAEKEIPDVLKALRDVVNRFYWFPLSYGIKVEWPKEPAAHKSHEASGGEASGSEA